MKHFGILLALLFPVMVCTSNPPGGDRNGQAGTNDQADHFSIGWASADITPDKPVLLSGQFHARVSEGVMDPVTATALAIESGTGESSQKAILISCELVKIDDHLRDKVREIVKKAVPGLSPGQIILNATHTHTAPYCSEAPDSKSIYGVELDAMSPLACLEFVSQRAAQAAIQAWNSRKPGGISYGLGHAVVGHNRLAVYFSGKSQMYGNTDKKDFSHIEGYEDHSVNLLYTWNKNSELTGIAINVACPSQVSESEYQVSADYWHDVRLEVRKRLGKNLFILPQCSAAGDQSPHLMIGSKAEDRMQRLMGADQTGRESSGSRKQIAASIADAVSSVYPYIKDQIDWTPAFAHRVEVVELSRRLIGLDDVDNALKEAEEHQKKYEQLLAEMEQNPGIKQNPRWYFDITSTYTLMKRGESVKERFELEKIQPKMPVEVHVVRLGDVVFATNPFELYLDYGMRIKARSQTVQTFLVQLSGSGTYLPVSRSIAGGSYGAVPASTLMGPEGGQELVEKTLEMISRIMN